MNQQVTTDRTKIYRLDDYISFRICGLSNRANSLVREDCTRYEHEERGSKLYYFCSQEGVHFHCSNHPEIELEYIGNVNSNLYAKCIKCDNDIKIGNKERLIKECLRLLNIEKFKDAKLIRFRDV